MIDKKRLVRSFRSATNGLNYVFKTEQNVKIFTLITFLVVFIGFFHKISLQEWAIITLVVSSIFSFEIFNTSLERILETKHENHEVKLLKDILAAATLISVIGSIVVGLLIFLPKILGGVE